MICFAKPVLVRSAKGRICNNMLYVRYVHLIEAKPIHEGQTHSRVREDVNIRTVTVRAQSKEISGREPQGAWRQDELIGGKPPVVK
jgi:hypothetical protein